MKKSQLLFITIITLTSILSADFKQKNHVPIKAESLQATCTIKIMKEKLAYANKEKSFDANEFSSTFKRLYDECYTIINSPNKNIEQLKFSENAWLESTVREINTLHQDDEVRTCFNKSIAQLEKITQKTTKKEKDAIVTSLFADAEYCSYQHALKISQPHLNAQIEQWESNKEGQQYNFKIVSIILKHTPCEGDNLEEDLQELYNTQVNSISFDDFVDNIKKKMNAIKKDPSTRQCLQDIIDFKSTYDAAQTTEDKENLKKAFCIQYFQCKRK